MLRRVAAFCRPLRPVLPLVSFPRSRGPVGGVPGLCWMWRDVPFVRSWCPVVDPSPSTLLAHRVPVYLTPYPPPPSHAACSLGWFPLNPRPLHRVQVYLMLPKQKESMNIMTGKTGERVHDIAWAPNGNEFILVFGEMPQNKVCVVRAIALRSGFVDVGERGVGHGNSHTPGAGGQGCMRREGSSEAAPEAVG